MLTISLLYGMPSFVLYILILFQIIRPKYRKTFNNPFFHLCFSIGVVDCLGYLAFFVFFHLPMYSLAAPIYGSIFFSSITLTTGVHFSLFMSGYLQIFGNCFLTLNRFTAIVLPLKHDKIWRVLLPMSIVITAAISIAPCWQLPSVGSSYVLQSGSAVGSYLDAMNSETIALIVSLLYGIPSFVLYALILFQMIRPKYRKTFSNAFFRLCFAIGVVDCLGYLGFYIFFTLPMYSITSPIFGSSLFAPSAFTTGISFTLFVLLFLQIIGNCFLTLNRFTAVVIPFRHDKIWRFFFPISVVVTIVVSIAMCWEASTATVLYSPLDGGYVLTQAIPNPGISFRILMTPTQYLSQ
ncbi:hypothetical protein QR680_008503 [Steinernema hermaphroditum]|uniref:Serpentine receptor class gamma n=1 Tax=Steinernema hermaphroditum TaxID=289476 RepID=A0AA39M858_9BILA|nr:hypothetical protein QR680_008503 [Steinernema hermaphroditum]